MVVPLAHSSADLFVHTPKADALLVPCTQEVSHLRLVLTAEGREYLDKGSPEAQVFAAIPPEGATKGELKARLPERSL